MREQLTADGILSIGSFSCLLYYSKYIYGVYENINHKNYRSPATLNDLLIIMVHNFELYSKKYNSLRLKLI